MKRSAYSIILMDEVVEAVDQLAAQQGTSRSNLINRILAEHVCCITPEQQMRKIFEQLTQTMDSAFRIQEQGSDAMLSLLGSIRYKYRPTIRYRVELYRERHSEEVGVLRISCRTQSAALLEAIRQFFRFWILLEQQYAPKSACAGGLYEMASNCLTLGILQQEAQSDAALGTRTGQYIRMFHAVLQSYFQGLQQELPPAVLQHALEKQYLAIREL